MTDLDVALHLIIEARAEIERLRACEHDLSLAKTWPEKCDVYKRYTPTPTKALVNRNLMTARRLLKKAYM